MLKRGVLLFRAAWLLPLAAGLTGCSGNPSEPASTPPAIPRTAPAPIALSADPWVLTSGGEGPYTGAYLGNGYLGQRLMQTGTGRHPEGVQPAFLAGRYNQDESLEALPTLTPLEMRWEGRVLGADAASFRGMRQELRLKEGTLVTHLPLGSPDRMLEVRTAFLQQQPDVVLITGKVPEGAASITLSIPQDSLPGLTLEGPWQGAFRAEGIQGEVRVTVLEHPNHDPTAPLPPGSTFALALRAAGSEPPREALSALPALDAATVERWWEGHRAAWAERWQGDIEIDGDPEAQQVVRACLFQLFCSVRPGVALGVPPMGLSANTFSGHVFWDMDSWMLPALLPQHPDLAREMLRYRLRTLEGARANARAEGLPGASFAWESGATGKETLKSDVFRHGRHVSGDVALAARQYWEATGSKEWLREAWPMLRATAENWAARARPDGKGGYLVRGVTTPDELAGQVDHSAWTHHVARVNLEFATEVGRKQGSPAPPLWGKVAAGLSFLRDPQTKLILPYAGFTEKTRAKQADLLLLIHPGEISMPADEMGKTYDYYAPRVIRNGPAMTDAIHAVVAARLGRGEEAIQRFRESYRPFVRPPYMAFSEKRSRDNLNFLTGAAGTVEAVIYGFAGLEARTGADGKPAVKPMLPPEWKALRLRNLQWRGKRWDVELKPQSEPVWTAR